MKHLLALLVCFLALAGEVSALNIVIDYEFDTFFNQPSHATAKAALEAAAADISAVVTSSLTAITTTNFSGSVGGANASANWTLGIENPTTGTNVNLSGRTYAANEIRIYVGMRRLTGSTLGEGGPGSATLSVGVSGTTLNRQAAMTLGASNATNAMLRGGGPTMFTLSGTIPSTLITYSSSMGVNVGGLYFDIDTNNDSITDNDVTLNSSWHFDHTTAVAAGKNDFYSTALHEILHVLGVGTSDSWYDNLSPVDARDWLGAEAIAEHANGGNNLINNEANFAHLASGTMSTRLFDGAGQEVAMDPTLTQGQRKYLTALDLAILRDLGYQTIPEPATVGLLLSAAGLLSLHRRRSAG